MILTGPEISKQVKKGNIVIDPFDPASINPNSYNLTLAPEISTYLDTPLDMKKEQRISTQDIPESGKVLKPGWIYLARTAEYTETHGFVPLLDGRSSIGRLGLFIHVTAGFGDVGFCGCWTLELHAVQPIRIYPGVKICQISYHQVEGEQVTYNSSKYQGSREIRPSFLYRELV